MRLKHLFTASAAVAALGIAGPTFAADDYGQNPDPAAQQQPAQQQPAQQPDAATTPDDLPKHTKPDMVERSGEYVVREGDTLIEIAEQELGSKAKWKRIADANGIDDPKRLRIGQKLTMPDSDEASSKL